MNATSLRTKLLIGSIFLWAAACSTSEHKHDQKLDEKGKAIELEAEGTLQKRDKKSKHIFYSLPSPSESALILKKSGAEFDQSLLNPIKNADTYVTTGKQALNLGIYLADLSYANFLGQHQTSTDYMDVSKKMADAMGIPEAIDKDAVKQMKENKDDLGATMGLIAETFRNSNSYLSSETSTLVVLGGWIEGLYIATKLVSGSSDNQTLMERIVDQRLTLGTVVNLMERHQHHQDIAPLLKDIRELKDIFDKVQVTQAEVQVETNTDNNVASLTSNTKAQITKELFGELVAKVESIRSGYIQ